MKPTPKTKQEKYKQEMRDSVIQYIDALYEHYSKLLFLRLDFGYLKEYEDDIKLSDIKLDIKHLLDNRRTNKIFKNMVGYVMKFEYGEERKFHVHALLVFDGQKSNSDICISRNIGNYWSETATEGKGNYFNCNANKFKYKELGIGIIDHSNTEKRKILTDTVMEYMFTKTDRKGNEKPDQNIDAFKSGKEKSIIKGMPPRAKSKSGRPRKKLNLAQEQVC